MRHANWNIMLVFLVSLTLPACMAGYLGKQGIAQLKVLASREAVAEVMPRLSPEQRGKIELIIDAKDFGKKELRLPVEGVYETFSDVHPDPIWNVSACPRDSLEPHTWRFPVLGPLPYIGYYDKADAERERHRLLELGLDVMMYGAGAFSSLGWFSDPIVPSMLRYSEIALVNTTLHESAHRFLYFKHAVDFNESFASFVGDYGAIRYFATRYGVDHQKTRRAQGERRDAPVFGRFVQTVIEKARSLYTRTDLSREQKIAHRAGLFAEAQLEYGRLPLETDVYDGFGKRPLDNAVLLSYRRYGSGQDLFDRLLDRCEGDLNAAMRVAKALEPGRAERRAGITPFTRLRAWLDSDARCENDNVKS